MVKTLGAGYLLLCLHSVSCMAGVEETIAYLESLLAQGKNIAILLVDMQTGYMPSFLENAPFMEIIEAQKSILTAMSGKKGVYFVDVNIDTKKGPTISELLASAKHILQRGLVMKKFGDSFDPVNARYVKHIKVVGKKTYESELDTDLDSFLKSVNVNDVFVTGCFSALCVYLTAKAAVEKGYSVIVDTSTNISCNRDAYFFGDNSKVPFDVQVREARKRWRILKKNHSDQLQMFNEDRYTLCED